MTAVLLTLAVLFGLVVPFDVFAEEEEPATGSDIHAMLYYIDPNKTTQSGSIDITKNLELVFQRGGDVDPDKVLFKHFTDFEDGKNKIASERNPWYREDYNGNKGTVYAIQVMRVEIKDRIAPTNMAGWFWQMNQLTWSDYHHLDRIDTSRCKTLFYTFCGNKKLEKVDLTCWNLPNLENAGNTFNGCSVLTDVNISNWTIPKATYIPGIFANCTSLETIDLSSFKINNPYTIGSLFDGCTNLKNVTLFDANPASETQLAYIFRNCSSLEEIDLSNWNIRKPGTFREMFKGCSSLKTINFGPPEHWGTTTNFWSFNGWENSGYERMFEGCTSLESLDLTCVKGALICSSMFKGCTSLKDVNLSYAGVGRENRKGYTYGAPVYPDLSDRVNIFEDCEELSWIKLSAEGWPAAGLAGSSVPPKSSWRKIDEPNKDLRISADELFQNFRSDYAGTWVADAFITLKGNGGSPNFQSVDGNKGVELTFDESQTVATRAGYDFAGWWSEKTGGTQLHSGDVPEHWSYYAHWTPHTYNLVLDGNGGVVPEGVTIDGAEISQDRKTITFSNVSYPDFVELSSKMFEKEGKSVLSSWNTRPNGAGTQYFVSDSVNQLTPTQGGTVTLFAMWDEPDYVVTFESNGGTRVGKKSYKQSNKYGVLPPSEKDGFTFLGWFPENSDTAVTENDIVRGDITLYARWEKNPVVTFDPQNGDSDQVHSAVYKYGHKLGVLPVPEYETRTFIGWFTQDGETQASNDTLATEDITYYAHWGYKPEFESNGGTYTEFHEDDYPMQDSAQYTITSLPSAKKPYHNLDGWYFIYAENGAQKEQKVTAGNTVDLSKGTVIRAKWTPTSEPVTVTCINKDPDDPDNAEKTITTNISVYRGTAIRQLPAPTRSGYDFAGWFRENSDTPETVESTFDSATTLYARWNPKNVPISFDANGGTLNDSSQSTVTVSSGGGIDVIPNATNSDKLLAGWYLKDSEGNLIEASRLVSGRTLPDTKDYGVNITDNATYYAKWIDLETTLDNDFFSCETQWTTQTSVDGENMGDTLVFRPVSGGKITAHLSLSFERVGNKEYTMPVGALQIKVPKKIFKDKNGTFIGENNIKGNEKFTLSETTIDGQEYVVYTNAVALKEDCGLELHYDVDPTELAAKTGDDLFFVNNFKVYVDYSDTNSSDPHSFNYERDMFVEVHTGLEADVKKTQASVSLVWKPEWGNKPADANEYFYVTWDLSAVIHNCTQKYKLRWSEDTAHDGTIIYSSFLDEWSEEHAGGTSTATVVTKHKRSEVNSSDGWYTVQNEAILDIEMASGEMLHYRPTATAMAYIPPSESTSGTNDPSVHVYDNNNKTVTKLSKTIKADYTVQDNHTKGYAQEYILNGNSAALTEMDYTINYTEVSNTDPNITWSDRTNSYTTVERTMILSDGNPGVLRISAVAGANKYKWGDSSIEQNLNPGDYSFTRLKIRLKEYDAARMNNTWSNPFEHSAEDYDDIIVRVRTTANSNLEVVPISANNGGNDYIELTLPEGTYYYEVEHRSSFYSTDLKVETSVKLNISNRLHSIVADHVADGYKTLIKNKADMTVTRAGTVETISSAKENDAWPAAYELTKGASTLYVYKRCAAESYVNHHESTSTEYFPVLLSAWNYNTGVNSKYIRSGEFNDLLPPECTVDKDTVFVALRTNNVNVTNTSSDSSINTAMGASPSINEARFNTLKADPNNLHMGNYSVVMTPDWQGSGRTMLTIKVTVPEDKTATGFNVYYMMKTSYSNINRRGTKMMNSVSFTDTTPKQSKPNLKLNTIDHLDSDTKPYFTSIDDEQTAYAKAQTNCAVPDIYTYGISSLVQAEGSKLTEHEIVGLNTNYFYNINYTNNSNTDNLVFFDTIEHRMDGTESQWQGAFKGIDVSQISGVNTANEEDGYCSPVVYYATKDKSLFTTDDFDLERDIWSQTPPEDLSQVTAIAIDCRKTDQGKDFVLKKKVNLAFNVYMHSPGTNVNNNDVTYNEAVVRGEIIDNDMEFYSYTYTDVTIKFSEPEFSKTAFPKSGTAENPAEVVGNSVLEYSLTVTNPDELVSMFDVTIEDYFDKTFNFNNPITVKIDEDEALHIENSAHVSSYTIEPVTVDGVEKIRFSAVIDNIDPEETITITIPVTVSAGVGTVLTNLAQITSMNGVTFKRPVLSDQTYHKVTGAKAKILKIKSNGEALKGAELQIFENNSTNFDPATGKIKSGAVALRLTHDGDTVGEGENNDYFTSSTDVMSFDIAPGSYVLHEKTLPANYETPADDIPFRVDVEGIHYIKVNNKEEAVSYIEMVNVAPYEVIYHTNLPTGVDEIFKTVDSVDLVEKKVPEFSDIPTFKGDNHYSFTGWYTRAEGGEKVTFDRTYNDTTHLYAHWQAYKVIFHENNPEINDKDVVFKTFVPANGELNTREGITHFYDIPSWAGDEYVFAGWYHNTDYLKTTEGITIAADFEKDTYLKKDVSVSDPDYHLYAKWIKVGTVSKDAKDDKILSDGAYRGFGLAGVQIREPEMTDSNFDDVITPGGLRFVTSLSESLLGQVNSIEKITTASTEAKTFGVEYGYVVGTESNINAFKSHYNAGDSYRLQYNGENVNGVNTTGQKETAANDYRYISNVDCTSRVAPNSGSAINKGVVALDHRNYNGYRLYTLIVTYEGESAANMGDKLDARAYMRYYDANGKLRVFYNDYINGSGKTYYGGCMCSYQQVFDMSS